MTETKAMAETMFILDRCFTGMRNINKMMDDLYTAAKAYESALEFKDLRLILCLKRTVASKDKKLARILSSDGGKLCIYMMWHPDKPGDTSYENFKKLKQLQSRIGKLKSTAAYENAIEKTGYVK